MAPLFGPNDRSRGAGGVEPDHFSNSSVLLSSESENEASALPVGPAGPGEVSAGSAMSPDSGCSRKESPMQSYTCRGVVGVVTTPSQSSSVVGGAARAPA